MVIEKRIFIVEDEPLIAMMLEDYLDALGYICAGSADSVSSALPHIDAGAFDIAILDVHLRDGEACWPVADALIRTGKPFLLASGGQIEALPPLYVAAPMIAKPFTIDTIRSALSDM